MKKHLYLLAFIFMLNQTDVLAQVQPSISDFNRVDKSTNSADFEADINPNGDETTYYIEYGTASGNYSSTSTVENAGNGNQFVDVSIELTGLDLYTDYFARLVAQNANGIVRSLEETFMTDGTAPLIRSLASQNPAYMGQGTFSAEINISINPQGPETDYYFEYGTSSGNYTEESDEETLNEGSSFVDMLVEVDDLENGVDYFFRLVADNEYGTTRSDEFAFTTLPTAPSITPLANTNGGLDPTDNSALIDVSINPEGEQTTYNIAYGTQSQVTFADYADQTQLEFLAETSGLDFVDVEVDIQGLDYGTVYYLRAVADNIEGITESAEFSFRTDGLDPLIIDFTDTGVTDSSVDFEGEIDAGRAETTYYIEYGSAPGVYTDETSEMTLTEDTDVANINLTVSGLDHFETYYFRLVAENDFGITESAELMIRTDGLAPSIEPLATTNANIDPNTDFAEVLAEINPEGPETEYYYEYGTSTGNYTEQTANQIIAAGKSFVEVSEILTPLEPFTNYFVRVVAEIQFGITNSSEFEFVTDGFAPTVANVSIDDIQINSAEVSYNVNPEGPETQYFIEYGELSGIYDNSTAISNLAAGENSVSLSSEITGLDAFTEYFFIVVAENEFGRTESAEFSFQTLTNPPVSERFEYIDVTNNQINTVFEFDVDGENPSVFLLEGTETGNYFSRGLVTTNLPPNSYNFNINFPNTEEKRFFAVEYENSGGNDISEEIMIYFVNEPVSVPPVVATNEFEEPTSFEMNFSSAASVGAEGYLVLLTNLDAIPPAQIPANVGNPVDFTDYRVGDMIGNSVVHSIVTDPNQEIITIDNLLPFVNYDITLVPFNWNENLQVQESANYELNNGVTSIQTLTPPTIEILTESDDLIGCFGEEDRVIGVGPQLTGGNLDYQWYKDGEKIQDTGLFDIDDNEAGLLFETLMHEHSGIYYVEVFGENFPEISGVRSREFVVNVIQTPEITKQPMNVQTTLGETVTLSVEANIYGMLPPSYRTQVQWYKGNTPIVDDETFEGALSSYLTITDIEQDDLTDYWVTLEGYCGMVTSNTITVTESEVVNIVNSISTDMPEYCEGDMAIVTIDAASSGGSPVSYMWTKDGTMQSEASNTFTFEVEPGVTHMVDVVAGLADGSGVTVSESIQIYGKIGAAITTATFNNIEMTEGDAQVISVDAIGDDITINWYKTTDLMTSLSNSSTFDLSTLLQADSGEYVVEVSNDCRTVVSDEFTITVNTSGFSSVELDNIYQMSASPNPTQSNSNINFNLDVASNVKVELFDATGNTIAVLLDGFRAAGPQSVSVNSNDLGLSSGVYFYTLTNGDRQLTKQLVITK